jgi:hypothetical protein
MKPALYQLLIRFACAAALATASQAATADHDLTCHPPTTPTAPRGGTWPLGYIATNGAYGHAGHAVYVVIQFASDGTATAHGSILHGAGAPGAAPLALVSDGATDASCAYVDGWPRLIDVTLLLFDARTHERLAAYMVADSAADATSPNEALLYLPFQSEPVAVTVGILGPADASGQPGGDEPGR